MVVINNWFLGSIVVSNWALGKNVDQRFVVRSNDDECFITGHKNSQKPLVTSAISHILYVLCNDTYNIIATIKRINILLLIRSMSLLTNDRYVCNFSQYKFQARVHNFMYIYIVC